MPRFGDIFYADLQADGHVQGGTRPVIIAQNDVGNFHSPVVEVIPLTSKLKAKYMPTHVLVTANSVNGLSDDSVVLAEQVRVIDKCALRNRLGYLDRKTLVQIGRARAIQSPFPKS